MSLPDNKEIALRLTALDRALEAWQENREFLRNDRVDVRTPRIIATAKEFEKYLSGTAECGEVPCEHAPDGGNHPEVPTDG